MLLLWTSLTKKQKRFLKALAKKKSYYDPDTARELCDMGLCERMFQSTWLSQYGKAWLFDMGIIGR